VNHPTHPMPVITEEQIRAELQSARDAERYASLAGNALDCRRSGDSRLASLLSLAAQSARGRIERGAR
jgi:hypothetical protein